MSRLRAAIVGCGKIFPMHAVSVSKQEGAELVAVCDVKADRAASAAAAFGCRAYGDYLEMLDAEKPDSVHICTPHHLHPPMAIAAAERGIHVLTEKPMAIRLEDALRMRDAAAAAGTRLVVSFQNRFNPGSLLLKRTIESGELGRVLGARALVTWNRSDEYYSRSDWKGTWDKEGGGVVIDQAIHTLDLLAWLVGSPVGYVQASWSNRAHDRVQVDDQAEGLVGFTNGVKACFFAVNYYTYDAPVELEIHCERGVAKMVGEKATVDFVDGRVLQADRDPRETFDFGDVKQYWGVGHMKIVSHFYRCLATGETPRNGADDVMATQRLVCAIYESGRTGKRVEVGA